MLSNLIQSHTEGLREDDGWSDAVDAEQANKQLLRAISRNWDEVAEHLRDTYEVGS